MQLHSVRPAPELALIILTPALGYASIQSVKVSIIIRTYNEQQYLSELLEVIHQQQLLPPVSELEVVIVDSGSTDNTLNIAKQWGCIISHIAQAEFTFGRSLNLGCKVSSGEVLVFVSGHCIPTNNNWLINLLKPLNQSIVYTYGKQIGRDKTKFSEEQYFKRRFKDQPLIPQNDIYCNNANSALLKNIWLDFPFKDCLTGLEDIDLSKRLIDANYQIGYCSEACVYHIHDESWQKIKRRYEREALALKTIIPGTTLSLFDTIKYFFSSIFNDMKQAIKEKIFLEKFSEIVQFRFMQYYGTYMGNHTHKVVTSQTKRKFFYP